MFISSATTLALGLAVCLAVLAATTVQPATAAPVHLEATQQPQRIITDATESAATTASPPSARSVMLQRLIALIVVIIGVVAAILATQALAVGYVLAPVGAFLQCACCNACWCCNRDNKGLYAAAADANNSESSTAKISLGNGDGIVGYHGDKEDTISDSVFSSPLPSPSVNDVVDLDLGQASTTRSKTKVVVSV